MGFYVNFSIFFNSFLVQTLVSWPVLFDRMLRRFTIVMLTFLMFATIVFAFVAMHELFFLLY